MIILPKIQEYASVFSGKESKLLKQLNQETIEFSQAHHMISGEYQGRFLSLISKMKQPKIILEIGTFTGYSALCLAEGLDSNGFLFTIDSDIKSQTIAKKYFSQSSYSTQIIPILGEAKLEIEKIDPTIDLAFIDADKKSYSFYFDKILPKMNSGGIILVDNVLWKGKVIEIEMDSRTKAIHEFNQMVQKDNRVEALLLPIRDGITMIRVK
jgi:caffeoyl-CoA O-methyltransferase